MIDRKEENTAVLVVDVQGDFTQLMNGSLAVEGTDQAYLDQVAADTTGTAIETMADAGVVIL
jgi:nicotinamidase/pyrazinamidase